MQRAASALLLFIAAASVVVVIGFAFLPMELEYALPMLAYVVPVGALALGWGLWMLPRARVIAAGMVLIYGGVAYVMIVGLSYLARFVLNAVAPESFAYEVADFTGQFLTADYPRGIPALLVVLAAGTGLMLHHGRRRAAAQAGAGSERAAV